MRVAKKDDKNVKVVLKSATPGLFGILTHHSPFKKLHSAFHKMFSIALEDSKKLSYFEGNPFPRTVFGFRLTFLLSSNTVFMFSIHTASTGPSKINHFLSSVVDDACSLNELARTPSDHSWETGSKQPYSSPMLIDLGLIIL